MTGSLHHRHNFERCNHAGWATVLKFGCPGFAVTACGPLGSAWPGLVWTSVAYDNNPQADYLLNAWIGGDLESLVADHRLTYN